MLQQQRPGARTQRDRDPVPSAPPRELINSMYATGSVTLASVTSQSVTRRRVALGQSYFESAKQGISEALFRDEKGERMTALEQYNTVLSALSLGLGQVQGSIDPTMVEIRKKMEKMKKQIKSRMEVLLDQETLTRQLTASVGRTAELESRTGQTSLSSSTTSQAGFGSVSRERKGGTRVGAKADLVFTTDTGIGLFQVDGQEHVRKYEDVDNLSIFRYHERIKGQPPAFLQCDGFIYPLIPGRSPVLKASERVYMFPDLKGEDGCSVGLTLEGASEADIAELDRLLTLMADVRKPEREIERERDRVKEQRKAMERGSEVGKRVVRERKEEEKEGEKPRWGTTIAEGIGKGVGLVSKGISGGTEVAGSLISKGASKLREKIEPNQTATEVPTSVQTGVTVARKTSGCVVAVSDFLMLSLAKLTVKVGKEVHSAVSNSEYMKDREINPQVKEAWKVTKSGVIGVATVFGDLERGAAALINSMTTETSKTVEHKYGEQAGKVTQDSLDTGKNVASLAYTYYSWKTWGIRFLGKIGEVVRHEEKDTVHSTNKQT